MARPEPRQAATPCHARRHFRPPRQGAAHQSRLGGDRFYCSREIVDLEEVNTYWQRVNETWVGHPARVLTDRGRLLILEGQGPVQGVTVYEFPSKEAARSCYDSVAHRESPATSEKGKRVQSIW